MNESFAIPVRPVQGRPRPIRYLLPHLGWEAGLFVTTVIVGIAVAVTHPGSFGGGAFWGPTSFAAMYAGALALSLRTATPNLAVTTIGTACGWWYVHLVNAGTSTVLAWLAVLAAALGVGLVLGTLVALTPLPAWAISLVSTGVLGNSLLIGDDVPATVVLQQPDGRAGTDVFLIWTVLFLLGSVAVALLLAVPSIRALISQNRPVPGVPAARWSGRLVGALVGLGGSSLLAGIGGILLVTRTGVAQPADAVGMGFALAAVLLGGVSLLGRRGGIAGVGLAVLLVALVQFWMSLEGVNVGTYGLVVGVLAVVGLGVNVLVELFGNRLERGPTGPETRPQPWPYQHSGWPQPSGPLPPVGGPQPTGGEAQPFPQATST